MLLKFSNSLLLLPAESTNSSLRRCPATMRMTRRGKQSMLCGVSELGKSLKEPQTCANRMILVIQGTWCRCARSTGETADHRSNTFPEESYSVITELVQRGTPSPSLRVSLRWGTSTTRLLFR